MDLKSYIRDVPDFPKPGIMFRDITPLIKHPEAFKEAVSALILLTRAAKADIVAGVESRGFLFAAPVAYELGLPLIPLRKAGKLPAERMSVEYSLEYDTSQLDIHKDAVSYGQRVVIIDDLLATGGTANASAKLVELVGGVVAALAFLVELEGLGGRGKLRSYPVESIVKY